LLLEIKCTTEKATLSQYTTAHHVITRILLRLQQISLTLTV